MSSSASGCSLNVHRFFLDTGNPALPGLEHEYIPERVLPILFAGDVLQPFRANGLGSKKAVATKAGFREQIFAPIAQGAAKPTVDGNAKAHLRPLDQRFRNILIEDLAKNPFARLIANLKPQRQAPGELHYTMIQQRYAR